MTTTPMAAAVPQTVAQTVLDPGPLAPFLDAGVLGAADLQVAATILRLTRTSAEPAEGPFGADPDVSLAIALTVRALREGSVCLTLHDDPARWVPAEEEPEPGVDPIASLAGLPWPPPERWAAAVAAHSAVAVGVSGPLDRPLRLVEDRLYLQRYWADEQLIAAEVRQRSRTLDVDAETLRATLARLFPDAEHDAQRLATAMAVTRASTIITGGPGTGKTTTVARLLAVLRELDPGVTIGLAAPTGKAAARLQEAVAEAIDVLGGQDLARVGHPPAVTLHRLLGWVPWSASRFAHHGGNPLPHDVVIVDESSMVALPMMARLLEAVRPEARLVLVGDADQLASVEAGAVLGDLVAAAPDWATPEDATRADAILAVACPVEAPGSVAARGVVRLERVRRFGGRIAELSTAIRAGDADTVLRLLEEPGDAVEFADLSDPTHLAAAVESVHKQVAAQARGLRAAAQAGDVAAAVAELDTHRVLCAHRRGPEGVVAWNELIDAWTRPPAAEWYPGRPILVNRNDSAAGVSNGDTGVTVALDGPTPGLRVAFPRGAEPLLLAPGRLEEVETLRSLTIHRAQGSQFREVTVVLPQRRSPLLTRELLYTAVTRAQHRVRILGTPAAIEAAVTTPVRRASGLRQSVRAAAPTPP